VKEEYDKRVRARMPRRGDEVLRGDEMLIRWYREGRAIICRM